MNAVDVLTLVQQIEEYQQVSVTLLCMNHVKIHSPKEVHGELKLSGNLGIVSLVNCCLSPQFYANIVTQLYKCKHIKLLELNGSPGVPGEISDALSAMSSLINVNLSGCAMTKEVSAALMSCLSHCCYLRSLNLSGNTLTNCLENLIPKTSCGYTCLKRLNLTDTKLGNTDVQNLQRVLQHSKLNSLSLSGNKLVGCLQLLDITELTGLELSGCQLRKADLYIVDSNMNGVEDALEQLIGVLYFMVKNQFFTHEVFCCFTLKCTGSNLSDDFLRNLWSNRIRFWKEGKVLISNRGELVFYSYEPEWHLSIQFDGGCPELFSPENYLIKLSDPH